MMIIIKSNKFINTKTVYSYLSYLHLEVDYMLETKSQEIASRENKKNALTEEDEKHLDASMNHNDRLMILLAKM